MIAAENHLGLVYMLADRFQRRHGLRGVEWDDLIGAGSVGLMQAVMAMDEAKSSGGNYMMRRIDGAIRDYVRSIHGRKGTPRRGVLILSLDDPDLSEEIFCSSDNVEQRALDRVEVDQRMSQLDQTEFYVISRCFLEDAPQKDVATALGLTEGRVSQVKSRALGKMAGVRC